MKPLSTTQDFNWITSRYPELQKKYPSRYIAVKNGKVVASGREFGKVYDAAVRRVKKDFVTGFILSGKPFVLDTRLNISLAALRTNNVPFPLSESELELELGELTRNK